MAVWIECQACGVEFRNQPPRTRCPECGKRIEREEEEEFEDHDEEERPRPRKKFKKPKKMRPAILGGLIGLGVLSLALIVVVILLLVGGKRADPNKVTLSNFQRLNVDMNLSQAEVVLGGSYSSSSDDLQREMTVALGPEQAVIDGMFAQMLTGGGGTWRRWDGANLKVWVLFTTNAFGKDRVGYSVALETRPDGSKIRHQGVISLGGGLPFQQPQQFPQFPFQK